MTKEIYISSTPHETRLALVEDDQLAEIYYERENEYTLAGSIYKGRVTRVLPGMQSAFVDVGLERDAFLYVTDFIEEAGEDDEIVALSQGHASQESRNDNREAHTDNRNAPRGENRNAVRPPTQETTPTEGVESDAEVSGEQGQGARRWRGRRGRRRGNDRGNNQRQQAQNPERTPDGAPAASLEASFSSDIDPLEESDFVEAEVLEI